MTPKEAVLKTLEEVVFAVSQKRTVHRICRGISLSGLLKKQ